MKMKLLKLCTYKFYYYLYYFNGNYPIILIIIIITIKSKSQEKDRSSFHCSVRCVQHLVRVYQFRSTGLLILAEKCQSAQQWHGLILF